MTNDYTTFLCLVLGQHPRHAFQVNCSRDASIADLRDQVQEKGGLEHVLAKDITLYYAELPCQDLDAIAKFQPANKYLLYPGLRIKSTPLTAREEYITVIAVLDSSQAAPGPLVITIPPESPFDLLHTTLWAKGTELENVVFHTVDVSIPVYARNDTSLTSHATSWSVKKFNTLNVSACFGGPVNKQLPCAYDLAHILVRDVYTELDRLLNEREKDEGRGVVVLGQPGIGKSVFLSCLLVKRLLAGKRTVLQISDKSFYLFSEDGVSNISDDNFFSNSIVEDEGIWALSDVTPDKSIVHSTKWFLVHCSSPKEDNYKLWAKIRNPTKYYMAAWSWDEVVAARFHCMDRGLERDVIHFHRIFTTFGPSARTIFSTLVPPIRNNPGANKRHEASWELYEAKVQKKVEEAVQKQDINFLEDQDAHIHSHMLVLIVPTSSSILPGHFVKPAASGVDVFHTLRPITSYIIERLVNASIVQDAKRGKLFFQQIIQKYPLFATSEGVVFETLSHRVFEHGPTLVAYRLPLAVQGSKNSQSHSHEHEMIISLQENTMTRMQAEPAFRDVRNLRDFIRERESSQAIKSQVQNIYLRPRIGNLAAVDAIAFVSADHIAWRETPPNFDPKYPTTILFQITVAYKHPISLAGINDLLDCVPAQAKINPIVLLWVVPWGKIQQKERSGAANLFTPQPYTDKSGKGGAQPTPYLHQMIATVSNDRLWSLVGWKRLKEHGDSEAVDLEDLELKSFEPGGHVGKVVREGKRIISSHIKTLCTEKANAG